MLTKEEIEKLIKSDVVIDASTGIRLLQTYIKDRKNISVDIDHPRDVYQLQLFHLGISSALNYYSVV